MCRNIHRIINRRSTCAIVVIILVAVVVIIVRKWQIELELANKMEAEWAEKLALEYNGNPSHDDRPSLMEKTIFIITPTYKRYNQKADLTRLSYTLMHVRDIFWIVVEDAPATTNLVQNVVQRSGIAHVLLAVQTPAEQKRKKGIKFARGVVQRNLALQWIRSNLNSNQAGVVYFADDDNTYDIRLFDEMRSTKLVSVWPVAFVGEVLVERPLVRDGRVVGFLAFWDPGRKFPIDMSGFAVNLRLIFEKKHAQFGYNVKIGHQETSFLEQLVERIAELEPKADNCNLVYVWHTRTAQPNLNIEQKLWKNKTRTDAGIEI
ncbi:Galactosylgalactosylxylosylprotein 3-beta-glucuronosyltransferase 1 [Trichinella nelsoni]|uniref:Galactosylgalactosylxylosylprotein 3-beta-glucuronosyltransferase n=1 Tax=Trichinella nelsoni TaxID=6336 RepID=A0A0V0RUK8_9BILA|nr:Galactosylgalactosylxylosylprotein 3-beta-glucuronosyltransferase 1 [Trichinella nelsoni]KRX18141.1 Galactosylgalactosylxylosylprotein 3-beta-glucuronosyltransferase 1 [Trichinella nelsoni]KRX18142.1 Galactosylgalactosylxylosylprotein 3-beta-glucuronosyltransferase 1 [Trichinella nelsoni]